MAASLFAPLVKVSASESGALESFRSTCTCCGLVVKSSQVTLAEQDIAQHEKWHAKRS